MDFRGRVYPCPPHFNHLGSDVVRGILLFARGEPLGENGLDWLKVHLINLTGLKKREPASERLKFANKMLPEILDSADNPMTGRRWWASSEEPWQTLACCREVAAAVRSPDPRRYVCHLPVHQDGSCNGLQHYAALGRDAHGARQVNLLPEDRPQDVYSGVAAMVERERTKDAANGVAIAQVLEGFIKRKVVKQTVMTVVYGVTRFGAHLQIMKQLKDLEDFPQEHCWAASHYLVQRTFLSLQEMFTATREIQEWLTSSAKLISQVCGQPVEWVTPLGLPVVQPYHKNASVRSPVSFISVNGGAAARGKQTRNSGSRREPKQELKEGVPLLLGVEAGTTNCPPSRNSFRRATGSAQWITRSHRGRQKPRPVCVGALDFGGRGDERLESISVSVRLLSYPKHELCKVTSEMVALAPSRWKRVFDVGPGALHRIDVRTSVRADKVQLVVDGEVREASVICKLAIASPTVSDYSCSRADPLGY
ncbi:DNA-directed RNA polymerase, mitochondrial isoform X2 [Ixodes scapularis]